MIVTCKRDSRDLIQDVQFGIMVKMLISKMDVIRYLQEFSQNTPKSFMG